MSLPHALLGLLAVAPASGYELTREFDRTLGRYAWQAGHTSIYPELGKLAARDLVRITREGPRGSKTYDITPAGREELRSWLLHPPDDGVVRNQHVLRMFLLSALSPADQRRILTAIAADAARGAAEVRGLLAAPDPDRGARAEFGRLAAEFGLRQYDAVHEWAHWALGQLADDEPVAVGGQAPGESSLPPR